MSQRQNCWEFMQCGLEPGGEKTGERGCCPAAEAQLYNGVNGGCNAGRFCWVIAGTLCNDKVQGTFAQKVLDCMRCPFYAHVVREQGPELIINPSQLM